MRALALGIALAFSATPASADWKNDYDRGLKAVEAGQWGEAQRLFANAAREEPEPAERKPFQGVVRKFYVPHYYAGLAAYRQNDCRTALEYWNHGPTNALLASKTDLKGTQSSGIADCNQKLAAASKPPVPTPTTTPSTSPTGTTSTPVATTTPSKPPPDKPVVVAPPPKPVETKPPVVATPTQATVPAPAALVSAVEAWVAGRYDAVAQLNPASFADGRSKAQALLLRAAARHTQAELSGDKAGLQQASQDVRAARQANAALAPDEVLFSPKFRAFWRATR
jgi:hypothetical protein